MVYLNNAATTYPKPPCVLDNVQACLEGAPVSQYRGVKELKSGDAVTNCRKALGELLNIKDYDRIWFTSGATEACNTLICGLDYGDGTIFTTETEHNSILRPLLNQEKTKNHKIEIIPCTSRGEVLIKEIEERILAADRPKVFFLNHCSNVTGQIQNLKEITKMCHRHGVIVIADVSQSAGCIPIKTDEWELDGIIFTGHKSLFGIQGTGGFYLRKNIPLKPLKYGGTGRNSRQLLYEDDFEFEVGTQNMPGIQALSAGVSFLLKEGIENVQKKEAVLMKMLYEGLEKIPKVQLYNSYSENHGPVMSLNIKGLSASDVAYILQNVYGITVRVGLHCAPLIHKRMGTEENGTVRVSLSYLNSEKDIKIFLNSIGEICSSL
ncbi:MAG: aminotransferase class V-fold PLP-dependent enzyme [Ruminococcus sp.]|nr:aminotransferase class V-fold PLP-dependent enzyme [Ruminococcus sp.]